MPSKCSRSVAKITGSVAPSLSLGRRRRMLGFALLFVAVTLWRLCHWGPPGGTAPLRVRAVETSAQYAVAEGSELAVFYNLYVPWDEAGAANALRVVEDQMGQIARELRRAEEGGNERRGVVLYNHIGNEGPLPAARMGALCRELHPRLECRLLRRHDAAGEDVTLQDVHDYCRAPDRAARRVTYLHSKGSYHSQEENHVWRRQMTEAALHPACRRPPDDACDVCGAQFYVRYAVMFPGNMWTARCDYVRTLLPPGDASADGYRARKERAASSFLLLELWGILAATLDAPNGEHYGLGRYAWEHWIASSPHVRPCEVHGTDVGPLMLLGKDPRGRPFGPEFYDWGMAPRRIHENLGGIRNARIRLEGSEELQFREYYFLPGNLLKWFHLYGARGVPAPDSWVWRTFPAGRRWKELVGRHGEHAVEEMVRASRPRYRSAFASELNATADVATMLAAEDALSRFGDPPVVVFYQITFPSDESARKKAVDAIAAQFDVLSTSQHNNATDALGETHTVLLYYSITGGALEDISLVAKLCEDNSDKITCRQFSTHADEGAYGEILQPLHAFCSIKTSFDVIHIANRLPGYDDPDRTFDATTIRATTSAVVSKACRPTGGCNVCGAEFHPLPFLHFTGNMFAASCGYVARLLPTRTWEDRLDTVVRHALRARVEGTYTTRQLPFTPRVLGSYQHSAEHWIGGHPRLRPCDAAEPRTAEAAAAPREGAGAPPGFGELSGPGEAGFRRKRHLAMREYYYLAGNVLRWHRLYREMPSRDSWVWRWFPDGPLWEAAARNSGEDAIHELIKQLSIDDD